MGSVGLPEDAAVSSKGTFSGGPACVTLVQSVLDNLLLSISDIDVCASLASWERCVSIIGISGETTSKKWNSPAEPDKETSECVIEEVAGVSAAEKIGAACRGGENVPIGTKSSGGRSAEVKECDVASSPPREFIVLFGGHTISCGSATGLGLDSGVIITGAEVECVEGNVTVVATSATGFPERQ